MTAEGVQAGTRETVEPLTVSALLQTREKQFDFLERLNVCEEVYADDLPVETHVMSGRWMDTRKTPKVLRSVCTARGYEEPHSE